MNRAFKILLGVGLAASLPNVAAAQSAQACFPACRGGYTCYQQRCVSLCNPACGDGERCTAAGECEPASSSPSPASVAAAPTLAGAPSEPAPPTIPAALSPPPATAVQPPAPAQTESPSGPRYQGSFVFGLHLGFELGGAGTEELCTSINGQGCGSTQSFDFDDRSPVIIAVDGLYHLTQGLRLGVAYSLIPYSAIKDDGAATTFHLGNEHGLSAVIEGLVPLRPSLALALRGHAGVHLMFVGGDQADANDNFLSLCHAGGNATCTAERGPFSGWTLGTMAGVVMGSHPRWRVDLAVDRYSVQTLDFTFGNPGSTGHITQT